MKVESSPCCTTHYACDCVLERMLKLEEALEWIVENCDTGYLYMGAVCGAGTGKAIRERAKTVLEEVSE